MASLSLSLSLSLSRHGIYIYITVPRADLDEFDSSGHNARRIYK